MTDNSLLKSTLIRKSPYTQNLIEKSLNNLLGIYYWSARAQKYVFVVSFSEFTLAYNIVQENTIGKIKMAHTFQQEYMEMPPITRAYTTACVLTTIAVVGLIFFLLYNFSFKIAKQKNILTRVTLSTQMQVCSQLSTQFD